MNSTNEILLFDRFLIMHDFCAFSGLIFIRILLYTCANVECIKLLLTYLLIRDPESNAAGRYIATSARTAERLPGVYSCRAVKSFIPPKV